VTARLPKLPVFPMTPSDCVYVCEQIRKDDFNELIETQEAQTKEAIIKQVLDQNGEHYTICNRDNIPVLVGGTFYENPGVATIWLIATDKISKRDWWVTTTFIKGLMVLMFENKTCHRIQASSIGWRTVAQKWLQSKLGLEYEGRLKGFCKNGYDLFLYGKVG
jgi:hypothetical protein